MGLAHPVAAVGYLKAIDRQRADLHRGALGLVVGAHG
jgi:hypothetical protein